MTDFKILLIRKFFRLLINLIPILIVGTIFKTNNFFNIKGLKSLIQSNLNILN